jgi:DNA-binding SARP family transcriptional activator
MRPPSYPPGLYLKTFGSPALLRDGEPIPKIRSKDLALLIYLRLECDRRHHRKDVADKLFRADGDAAQALYSANGRLKKIAADLIAARTYGWIQGNCGLPCDAAELLEAHRSGRYDELDLGRYVGGFLEGFELSDGADGFEYWKTTQWTRLRVAIEPVWQQVLTRAAERGDWDTVRDRALEVLNVDPEAMEMRVFVLRAWLELGQFTEAEANYESYRAALERVGEEPAAELVSVIAEIRRRKTIRIGSLQLPGTQSVTSFSHVTVPTPASRAFPEVDVFLSAAMASTESPEQYEIERAQAMLMVHALRDLGCSVFFAGEDRPTVDSFEDEGDALEEVFGTVRRCRLLLLFYPRKRPSSSLIELGMAMAFGKRCVVLVSNRNDLPYLLVSPSRHYPPVDLFRYRDMNDVLNYLRANFGRLQDASAGARAMG